MGFAVAAPLLATLLLALLALNSILLRRELAQEILGQEATRVARHETTTNAASWEFTRRCKAVGIEVGNLMFTTDSAGTGRVLIARAALVVRGSPLGDYAISLHKSLWLE